ncbi:MAG: hypothetical protein ACLQF1_09370 [Methyloceanibacter sp.]
MAAYFSAEHLAVLKRAHEEVHKQFTDLRERFTSRNFKSDRAREFARHGFARRLGTLVRTIDQVFKVLPPEREDIPERDEVVDATIAIQSFVFNTFGCIDNLAWIWVYEKDVKKEDGTELDPKSVGLGNKQVRSSFSNEFRAYLDSRQTWFDHIKEFRDSLAHRIPLYIPPYIVIPETVDEYNRLEQASGEALRRADFKEYDRLQSEQKTFVLFRPSQGRP